MGISERFVLLSDLLEQSQWTKHKLVHLAAFLIYKQLHDVIKPFYMSHEAQTHTSYKQMVTETNGYSANKQGDWGYIQLKIL